MSFLSYPTVASRAGEGPSHEQNDATYSDVKRELRRRTHAIFEKTVLMVVATPGMSAPAATATNPAIRASRPEPLTQVEKCHSPWPPS